MVKPCLYSSLGSGSCHWEVMSLWGGGHHPCSALYCIHLSGCCVRSRVHLWVCGLTPPRLLHHTAGHPTPVSAETCRNGSYSCMSAGVLSALTLSRSSSNVSTSSQWTNKMQLLIPLNTQISRLWSWNELLLFHFLHSTNSTCRKTSPRRVIKKQERKSKRKMSFHRLVWDYCGGDVKESRRLCSSWIEPGRPGWRILDWAGGGLSETQAPS